MSMWRQGRHRRPSGIATRDARRAAEAKRAERAPGV